MAYVPIRTSTIRPDVNIPFPVYLQIDKKYVQYKKDGDVFDLKQLENLKIKKVRKVYIDENSESKYQAYIDEEINSIENTSKSVEERSEIVRAQSVAAVEGVFEDPNSESSYKMCEEVAGKSMAFIVSNPEALKQVSELASYDYNIYQHSLNVSTVSLTLGAALGLSEDILKIMSQGCMVHDIGKTQLDIPIMKPIEEMNDEQLKLYKSHPEVGMKMMQDKAYVDKKILEIILQHNETLDGTGFPSQLKNLETHIQVIGLANKYDRFVVVNKMSPAEAWKKLQIDHVGQFELSMIKKLKDVLQSLKMF